MRERLSILAMTAADADRRRGGVVRIQDAILVTEFGRAAGRCRYVVRVDGVNTASAEDAPIREAAAEFFYSPLYRRHGSKPEWKKAAQRLGAYV